MNLNIKVIGNPREDVIEYLKKCSESIIQPINISLVLTDNIENVAGENTFVVVEENRAKFVESGMTLLNVDITSDIGKDILWTFILLKSSKERMDEFFIEKRFARKLVSNLLQSMIVMMEVEDENGRSHSQRVTNLSLKVGEKLGYSKEELEILKEGAMLHDVGKIGVEQLMLYSPTRLRIFEDTPQDHTIVGTIFIASLRIMDDIIPIVRSHHERWDGKGYPDELKGEEIPEMARIVAVCNWFDNAVNFVSSEIAADVMSVDEALNVIEKGRGRNFDPRIANIFLTIMRTSSDEI